MCGKTRQSMIKNDNIKERIGVEKMMANKLWMVWTHREKTYRLCSKIVDQMTRGRLFVGVRQKVDEDITKIKLKRC